MSKLVDILPQLKERLGIDVRFDRFIANNGMAYLFKDGEWVSTIHFEGWEE